MKDTLKRTFYFGVGAVTMTAQKIEELVDELVQKGEARQGDRAHLIDEFMTKAREQERVFSSKVREIIHNYGFPGRKEFDALEMRVKALEKQLAGSAATLPEPKNDNSADADSGG